MVHMNKILFFANCRINQVHPVPGAEEDVGYQRVEDRGQQQRHQVEDGHVGEEQDLYTQSRLQGCKNSIVYFILYFNFSPKPCKSHVPKLLCTFFKNTRIIKYKV